MLLRHAAETSNVCTFNVLLELRTQIHNRLRMIHVSIAFSVVNNYYKSYAGSPRELKCIIMVRISETAVSNTLACFS